MLNKVNEELSNKLNKFIENIKNSNNQIEYNTIINPNIKAIVEYRSILINMGLSV